MNSTDPQSTVACPYCDRREPSEHLQSLHVGEEHWERATEGERQRYREAYEEESAALWRFRLLAVGVLVVVYFAFLFAYAIVG
ncbi:MAG: C2H2-type zinc finger protein [Halanaeroarchaeum sp.]